jgi:hypothetical protein
LSLELSAAGLKKATGLQVAKLMTCSQKLLSGKENPLKK